jgi:hypothetical protein
LIRSVASEKAKSIHAFGRTGLRTEGATDIVVVAAMQQVLGAKKPRPREQPGPFLGSQHDPEKWKPVFRKDHAQKITSDQ